MRILKQESLDMTRCLYCKAELTVSSDLSQITCSGCDKEYPIINGVPIMIKDDESLFSTNYFINSISTTYAKPKSNLAAFIIGLLPKAEVNINSKKNYKKISELLKENSSVLVVGGGIDGHGFEFLRERKDINIICTDVSIEDSTDFICDGHSLPFRDNIFQCVIFQAVLEHVLEPKICVKEAHRVLADGGLIYSETPFMQQVHMGAYDFQRFTESGHRRLFSFFQEISSGVACGVGSALCWSLIYFLQSFTSKRKIKTILYIIGRAIFFPVKYFDYFTHTTRGTIDGASGFYFLGSKTEEQSLSDAALIKRYNGLC